MKFQRALLAAHLERPEPTLRDAGRERGEPVEQGRGRQHAIVGLAARLLDPRGCVHRVADQRDLQVAEFADCDRAAVKTGAEVGDKTELALVSGPLRAKPVESDETGANASRLVHAWSEPPGRDDLVTHLFVDFADGFGDGERKIDNKAVEQVQKAELAQALSDRSRGAHVDEQERPFLDARLIIAPRREGEERPPTEQIVDTEQEVADDDQTKREEEVDAADYHELTRHEPVHNGVDDEDDAGVEQRAQSEIR